MSRLFYAYFHACCTLSRCWIHHRLAQAFDNLRNVSERLGNELSDEADKLNSASENLTKLEQEPWKHPAQCMLYEFIQQIYRFHERLRTSQKVFLLIRLHSGFIFLHVICARKCLESLNHFMLEQHASAFRTSRSSTSPSGMKLWASGCLWVLPPLPASRSVWWEGRLVL